MFRNMVQRIRFSQPAVRAAWFILLALPFFLAPGCAEQPQKKAEGVEPELNVFDADRLEDIILSVGAAEYPNSSFYTYLRNTVGDDASNAGTVALSRLYDDFVDEKILLAAARASGISLSEEEEADFFLKLRAGSTDETRARPLNTQERQAIVDRLLIEKYSLNVINDVDVGDEEIQSYYEENKRDFLRSESVKVSQILLPSEDQAVALYEELKSADEAAFKRTAREKSKGMEAGRGGEMGVFELGQLPFEMEKVIFSLQEGEVSRVVESAYGFHIFRLDERYEAALQSADDARETIRSRLIETRINESLIQHVSDLNQVELFILGISQQTPGKTG